MKHRDLHAELMKDWRYRFWWYVYRPRYWLGNLLIRYRMWRRQREDADAGDVDVVKSGDDDAGAWSVVDER